MNLKTNKKELIAYCLTVLEEKLRTIDKELDELQASANEETKSSAGDKYETGRAMLMIEKEKLLNQKERVAKQLKPLKTIDPERGMTQVETGAIVVTPGGNYFIASSIGRVELSGDEYFVVSPLAPVAQQMLGKSAGDRFDLNGKKMEINSIH